MTRESQDIMDTLDRVSVDVDEIESTPIERTIFIDGYQTSYDWAREDGNMWELYWSNLAWIGEVRTDKEEQADLIEINYEELYLEYLDY